MSEPFIGEIRPFALGFTPYGWLLCDGSRAPLSNYQALYSLVGAMYGPTDNRTYFTLPNFRSITPVHWGATLPPNPPTSLSMPGLTFGETTVTLTSEQMPRHTHALNVATNKKTAWTATPTTTSYLATPYASTTSTLYLEWGNQANASMNPATMGAAGGSQPHGNCQPYLAFRMCIAAMGIYPPRN